MPFAYDSQIASQPDAVARVLGRADVPSLDPSRPVVLAGIGTSLHACRVAGAWMDLLSNGALRAHVVEAHELALLNGICARDQVVVVSHRGTKTFPGAALAKARAAGARTVAVVGDAAPDPQADFVLRTCPDEKAGTHTVSYLTALATLGQLVAKLCADDRLLRALQTVPDLVRQALARPLPDAARLARRDPILVAGFGLDAINAAESALKLKEATYAWAEGMSVELALHGPPASMRPGMGAITFTPASDDGGRTTTLRALLRELGAESLTCGSDGEDLSFPPCDPLVRPLVGIVPVQRYVAEIARLTGSTPDFIHRDVDPWRSAMGRLAL